MINTSNISRIFSSSLAIAVLILTAGSLMQADAQGRDPFKKPGYATPRPVAPAGGVRIGKDGKPIGGPATSLGIPTIESRIEYYKRLRENAAANGASLPKVTSVLTVGEMAVTGIFRTPRGYAAMVEATPIKLSYTIYPGEKFFDGQLVAVEENRLVFRKVSKMSNGKFVSSVENKPLRKFTTKSEIQGTAPVTSGGDRPIETASSAQPASAETKSTPTVVVSPLDEMNRQPAESNDKKSAKGTRKTVKVAKNN